MDMIDARYHLKDRVGQGGMGVVYRARDRLTGQQVALKRVLNMPADAGRASTEQRLLLAREFQILARLHHPGIISVLDYGFDESGLPFYTMQFLEDAQPLSALRVSVETAIDLLRQLLEALAYLHRHAVIHRDLKPENVMVSPDMQVRVLDFGLAIPVEQDAEAGAGTLRYMAPELLTGGVPSPASDLYAVGVLAYQLLTGEHPFATDDMQRLLQAILFEKPDVSALPDALQPFIARLLAPKPESRYPTTEAALAALYQVTGQPLPPEDPAVRESFLQAARFTGRKAELEMLTAALGRVQLGQGGGYLIGGVSGAGKSRLMNELRIRALVEPVTVLRGQALADGGQEYHLWHEPVRQLLLTAELTDAEASLLRHIVPDIETLLARPVPPSSAQVQPDVLAGAIMHGLQSQPLSCVLLLDELQWASPASLGILKILSRAAASLPLLLVAAYRDDEMPDLPDRFPDSTSIALTRLSADEIASLSHSILGEAGVQPHILNLLERETEGNAFFLVEVIRALAEEAGSLRKVPDMALPVSVMAGGMQQVLKRRLARVPEWGRSMLKLAAVAGRMLDIAVLTAAGDDLLAHHSFADWLSACEQASVLEFDDGGWQFAHDKLRETVRSQIDEVHAFHARLARAIETVYPDDPLYVRELFAHWQHAGSDEKALAYLPAAAERLIELSADYERALDMLDYGLAVLDDHPDAAQGQLYAHLLQLKGHAFRSQTRYPEAKAVYNQVLVRAADRGWIALEASVLRALGMIHYRIGEYAEARAVLEVAHTHFTRINDRQGIALCLNTLGNVLLDLGDCESAYQTHEQALSIRRELGDIRAIAMSLGNLSSVLIRMGQYSEALALFREARQFYETAGDIMGVAQMMKHSAVALSYLGAYDEAQAALEKALHICQQTGSRHDEGVTLHRLGTIVMLQGNYDSARHHLQESLAINQQVEQWRGVAECLAGLGRVELATGDYRQAEDYFTQSLNLYESNGSQPGQALCLHGLGEVAIQQALWTQAAEYLHRSLTIKREMGDPYRLGLTLARLVVVYLKQGDHPAAREAFDEALRLARQVAVEVLALQVLVAGVHLALADDDLMTAAQWLNLVVEHPRTRAIDRRALLAIRPGLEARLHESPDIIEASPPFSSGDALLAIQTFEPDS